MSVDAFELVSVIERLVQPPSKTQIASLEAWEDRLYIGTSDGFIVMYILETSITSSGKTAYGCTLKNRQRLTGGKPIDQIQVVPAHYMLVVLCDTHIFAVDMATLKPADETKFVKNALHFCRNESSNLRETPLCQVTVSKKKGLQHFDLTGGVLVPTKELKDLDDAVNKEAVVMSRDGDFVCVAQKNKYHLVNARTRTMVELFPFDPEFTNPIVKHIGPAEFLLSVWTGGLTMGMFVTTSGNTCRPPVQWPVCPNKVAFNFPYIIGICVQQGLLTVHSILDQQNKQVLPFKNAVAVNDTTGRIFVASDSKVSVLEPISFDRQIRGLMGQVRISEAVSLARSTMTKLDDQEQSEKLAEIQLEGVWGYMSLGRFQEAFELLLDTKCDYREIISFFDGMLPKSSPYQAPYERAFKLTTFSALVPDEAAQIEPLSRLAQYLQAIRNESMPKAWKLDVDLALAQVLAATDGAKLLEFVKGPDRISIEDCSAMLRKHSRHHALAILFLRNGAVRQALDIWKRIDSGELLDPLFEGSDFVINCLQRVKDVDVIFNNVGWILKKNHRGVLVFTQRPAEDINIFRYDEVLEFLQPYPEARIIYLEYLVLELKVDTERYHTALALQYLNDVLEKQNTIADSQAAMQGSHVSPSAAHGPPASLAMIPLPQIVSMLGNSRQRLQTLLRESRFCNFETVLEHIKNSDLYEESIIIYGKLEMHEQALNLLVHRLGDHKAAELYCYENTKSQDRASRQRLFMALLRVYLVPEKGKKEYLQEAVNLLNSHLADLDVAKVLALVPHTWSIGVISKFLTRSVRTSMHTHRTAQIEESLARQDHLQVAREYFRLAAKGFVVTEATRCRVCNKLIGELPVARYPNGVICHARCAVDPRRCPVTGTLF